jgi:predicted anti-sigma-YlaC factor YlaD
MSPRFGLPWRRRAAGPPGGLVCAEIVALVTEYLEGAMAPADAARFEQHIAVCGACTMYLDQLRDTLDLLGELTPDALSPEAERELRDAFRDWKAGRAV